MNNTGYYQVKYIVRASGVEVTKGFNSPYLAQKLVNKLRHSKKCRLVSFMKPC